MHGQSEGCGLSPLPGRGPSLDPFDGALRDVGQVMRLDQVACAPAFIAAFFSSGVARLE